MSELTTPGEDADRVAPRTDAGTDDNERDVGADAHADDISQARTIAGTDDGFTASQRDGANLHLTHPPCARARGGSTGLDVGLGVWWRFVGRCVGRLVGGGDVGFRVVGLPVVGLPVVGFAVGRCVGR